jgi:DNA-binding NarL/FixJ family response regulator
MENLGFLQEVKILIADDHKLVSKLIFSYLQGHQNISMIGSANSGDEAIDIVANNDVDVAILDILMPDKNGLQLAQEILAIKPNTKIIFLTSILSRKVITDALRFGAKGFITKSANLEEILDAIRLVLRGDRYFSRDCMKVFIDESVDNDEIYDYVNKVNDLTEREKEILGFIIHEYSIPEIAEKLCLSNRTVETHKKNIMTKLGVKSTIALVKLVYEKQILSNSVMTLVSA